MQKWNCLSRCLTCWAQSKHGICTTPAPVASHYQQLACNIAACSALPEGSGMQQLDRSACFSPSSREMRCGTVYILGGSLVWVTRWLFFYETNHVRELPIILKRKIKCLDWAQQEQQYMPVGLWHQHGHTTLLNNNRLDWDVNAAANSTWLHNHSTIQERMAQVKPKRCTSQTVPRS